jgi:hypothetical protein
VPGSLDRPGQPHAPDQPEANDTPRQLRSTPPRPDLPTIAESSDDTDRLAARDRPGRWSRAELRQRLEHLPPGHPSSLQGDDLDDIGPPGTADQDLLAPAEKTEQNRIGRREPNTPDQAQNDSRYRDAEMDIAPDTADRRPDAERAGGLDSSDRPADAVKRNYWTEVPRFLRAWTDHVRRWPAEVVAAVVDRSKDPAGSWRGDGNQYLDPVRHEQSNDLMAGVRRIEKKLTEHVKETEHDNTCGGWLAGLEFCRKGDDRLKEKIADSLRIAPMRTPEEVIREIPDAIRYTFCFEPANYSGGYWEVKQRLETHAYRMVYSKNHWRDDPEYKGINTRWVTGEGQLFELQFHTPESYHAKQEITHRSYERIRNRLTGRSERLELEAFQREVCSWITMPDEITSVPDYEERY